MHRSNKKNIESHFPKTVLVASVTLFILLASSCTSTPTVPTATPTFDTVSVTGIIVLPDGADISAEDVTILSFDEKTTPGEDGTFSIDVPVTEKQQIIFAVDTTGTGKPFAMGILEPGSDSLIIDTGSTAAALTLFNVNLIYSGPVERTTYLDEIINDPDFAEMQTLIETAMINDLTNTLSPEYNPSIYQTTEKIMENVMEDLSLQGKSWVPHDTPDITSGSEGNIVFENPRQGWYAAGIYPGGEALSEIVRIEPPDCSDGYAFGWPPEISYEPGKTELPLEDGYYEIHLAGSFRMSSFGSTSTPEGESTTLNTAASIMQLIDLTLGSLSSSDPEELSEFISPDNESITTLTDAVSKGDVTDFMLGITELTGEQSNDLGEWIWGKKKRNKNADSDYLRAFAFVMKSMINVFDLMEVETEHTPFFGDLVMESFDVKRYISKSGDDISDIEQQYPPQPDFSITPGSGTTSTEFTFDASASADDADTIGNLEFRWDWDSDGEFDTDWSTLPFQTHSFEVPGTFSVTLEARDSYDLTGKIRHNLQICSVNDTPVKQVKVFADMKPYSSIAVETVLEDLGFSKGLGDSSYQTINSEDMCDVSIVPGKDLLIISNDQEQPFYDAYATCMLRFMEFLSEGGTILWEVCENPLNGSISDAGIILPGGVTLIDEPDTLNLIPDGNLPLVAGLPDSLDHNYASNRSFGNLPDGAVVYCTDSKGRPTLIEFGIGNGRVMMTGQPLEHQYDHIYGRPDLEKLLPRILAELTGFTE